MNELIQVSDKVYYIDCPTKVGIIKTSEDEVCLIDSGNNKDAGRRILKILSERGWRLTAIYNTHSHADHIGANKYLYDRTGCKIYAPAKECGAIVNPILEPMIIFGGDPPEELRHKFLLAEASPAEELTEDKLPDGLKAIPLDGHCFGMVGYLTDDGIFFAADALCSPKTLEKYSITYITDVKAYLGTLDMLKRMDAKLFIPSHAEACEDIVPLAKLNEEKVMDSLSRIERVLECPMSFDDILMRLFSSYSLAPTYEQYFLVGSTMRTYMTYLKNEGRVACEFENGNLLWRKI